MFNTLHDIKDIIIRNIDINYEQEILDIFNEKITDFTLYDDNPAMLNIIGMYYHHNKNINDMIKYYSMAADKGNYYSMNALGVYYYKTKKYDLMLKYYLMAVDLKYHCAMFNLGIYYQGIQDYANMLKYYIMAIEHGNIYAYTNIGNYYSEIQDYVNMLKYYILGSEQNRMNCIHNLVLYYNKIKDHNNMKKYMILYLKNNREIKYTISPNKVVLFDIYLELKNKEKLEELYFEPEVLKYVLKYKYQCFEDECNICREITSVSKCLCCSFLICAYCYIKLDKCPQCRKTYGYLNETINYTNVTLTKIDF